MGAKTFLIIYAFLFSLTSGVSQSLTLISWNLKDLGSTKDSTELCFIAQTIRHADVVAIQEVVAGDGGAQAVARLVLELNTMGASWDYVVSDPTSSSAYKTERYAFVWKKSKVKLMGKPWLEKKYGILIDREPYFATFTSGGKSLTVVNFHAITKSKQPETEVKYFKLLPEEYPGLNLIFVGDFNLPQSHSVFNPLKKMGYHPALTNQKTSLRQRCLPDGCLASEYDNILYKPEHLQISEKGIIHFYEKVDTFEKARLISDHVPVYIKFSIN
ncbi:MAG: endonuclease/exonuclease/phosphatase family protein [Lentimicrobium sp.]|jgi:endonuclease/exonuclease/phosphatase family metal-dependent hydrolase|nr:endonuclease/exonuclease/phosphatase family protein [Lentimicrobium sp.]